MSTTSSEEYLGRAEGGGGRVTAPPSPTTSSPLCLGTQSPATQSPTRTAFDVVATRELSSTSPPQAVASPVQGASSPAQAPLLETHEWSPISTTQSLYTPSASSPSASTPTRTSHSPSSSRHEPPMVVSRRMTTRRQARQGSAPYVPRVVRAGRNLLAALEDQLLPTRWPSRVVHLHASFNPSGVVFPSVGRRSCQCAAPCLVGSCPTSLADMYCTRNSCPFGGNCGNGIRESEQITLMKSERTGEYAVMATEPIGQGVSLGQYLGVLEHVHADPRRRPPNKGYMLVMRQRPEQPTQNIRIGIDAACFGGMLRFANHSCAPNAEFRSVASGRNHTVIAVTLADIQPGEEIKINYGPDLWFPCRCGLPTCVHRDL